MDTPMHGTRSLEVHLKWNGTDAARPHLAHGRPDALSCTFGIVALVGIAFFAITCLFVEFLRTDLDWFTTALSVYVIGPYGTWVRACFYAPAPGIAAIGIGWYRTLDRRVRSPIPLALFVAAAVGLCMLASFTTDTSAHPVTLHGTIHEWSTFGTFVCVTTAMVVQSWQVRRDPPWRFRFLPALTLATITVVYFWIFALVDAIPRGIGEKAVIGLTLLWLWRAAWWLVRGGMIAPPKQPPAPQRGP